MYLIFSMFGKKLFAVTEKIFMRSGDAQKARIKAVITEFLVFFLFILLFCNANHFVEGPLRQECNIKTEVKTNG